MSTTTIQANPREQLEQLIVNAGINGPLGPITNWYKGPGLEAVNSGLFGQPDLSDGMFSDTGLGYLLYITGEFIVYGKVMKLTELLKLVDYNDNAAPEDDSRHLNIVDRALEAAKYIETGLELRAKIKALSWKAKAIVIMLLHDDTPEIQKSLYPGQGPQEDDFARDLKAVHELLCAHRHLGIPAPRTDKEGALAIFKRAGMDPWV